MLTEAHLAESNVMAPADISAFEPVASLKTPVVQVESDVLMNESDFVSKPYSLYTMITANLDGTEQPGVVLPVTAGIEPDTVLQAETSPVDLYGLDHRGSNKPRDLV